MTFHNIDYNQLRDSLYYLNVDELRAYCKNLDLSVKGKKINLINRIIHFLNTGEKIDLREYPMISISKDKRNPILTPDAFMLKGAYKNDLKTRLFFKNLIGEHFHFTAFGIDWLEARWMRGDPPTYKEFIDMWNEEYEFRKVYGRAAKVEWAYINFVKIYLNKNHNPSRNQILNAWKTERIKHKELVEKFFKCKYDV